MKRYLYDGTTIIRAVNTDTGAIACVWEKDKPSSKGNILWLGAGKMSQKELDLLQKDSRAIPTALLLEVIQTYSPWTLFDVSLQLNYGKSSHVLQWNGKRSLRDMGNDSKTRMVTLKNFYPNEGFWVITSITTQEDMYAN